MSEIDSLCAAICAQPADRWDTDTMARRAHYSRWHFIRTFRRQVGLTPGRYVALMRMEAARELLLSGQPASVADVCVRVGYSSVGSFVTSFGARYGLPPGLYRRLHAATVTDPERTPA